MCRLPPTLPRRPGLDGTLPACRGRCALALRTQVTPDQPQREEGAVRQELLEALEPPLPLRLPRERTLVPAAALEAHDPHQAARLRLEHQPHSRAVRQDPLQDTMLRHGQLALARVAEELVEALPLHHRPRPRHRPALPHRRSPPPPGS